jgi:3-isopropylmalate/(R)-2-methylmalate dehydratase small subunit
MAQFSTLTSHLVPLLMNDIDTDQIIPARFLKVTDKAGIGRNLFADWRYDAEGKERGSFILNHPRYRHCQVLLAGHNFGCGSSREHAPWALVDYGFRVVISTSFADIFCNNALKNGLLPVALDSGSYESLVTLSTSERNVELTVDLASQTVKTPAGVFTFPIDPFAKTCLLNGVDELGYILTFEEKISTFETRAKVKEVA